MKKGILNLKGVKTITTNDQKKINGGGGGHGFNNPISTTPIDPVGPELPNWQWMCYSSGTKPYNKPQFFKSETNLSLTDWRYKCFKL